MSETTTKIDYYQVIAQFCATSQGRWKMQKPFIVNGYAYATDGKWLARCEASKIADGADLETEGLPAAEDVWKTFTPSGKFIPIELIDARDCEKCGGVGFWICSECEHEHDCKECDTPQPVTFKSIEGNSATLDILRVNKLVEIGFSRVELNAKEPDRRPVKLEEKGVEVLLMPEESEASR